MNQVISEKNIENKASEKGVIKINGSKFVVWFILFSAVVAVTFCYAIYQSYLTRPKIKIEEQK